MPLSTFRAIRDNDSNGYFIKKEVERKSKKENGKKENRFSYYIPNYNLVCTPRLVYALLGIFIQCKSQDS